MNGIPVEGFMYPNEIELPWSVLIVLYPFLTVTGRWSLHPGVAGAGVLRGCGEANVSPRAIDRPGVPAGRSPAVAVASWATRTLAGDVPDAASPLGNGDVRLRLLAFTLPKINPTYPCSRNADDMPITVMIQPTSLSISSERSLMLDEPRVSFVKQSLPSRGGLREHDNVAPVIQPDLEYQDCHQVPHDPWWSSPLMPVVFIFSAMVSGIAAVMLLYMFLCGVRGVPIDMRCVDTVAKYLFYTFLIDFTLELLDLIHRIYESDEWFRSLDFMVHTKLYFPHIVIQILLSTVMPIVLLAMTQVLPLSEARRKFTYGVTGCLTLIGIFAMRWNVVIGGQLFSKSVLGYSIHKMGFVAREGPLVAIFLTLLPFFIGWTLIKLLPPWAGDVLARHAPHRCRAWGRFEVN